MHSAFLLRRRIMYRLTKTRKRTVAVTASTLLLFPVLLAFGVETIGRGTFTDAWMWIGANPALFAINALLYSFVFLFLYCLLGSLVPSAGVTALLMFTAALISYFKTKMIGEPFFPWDILLKKEGTNIIPLVSGSAVLTRVAIVAAIVLGLFLLRLIVPRFRLPILTRLGLGVLAVVCLYGMAGRSPAAERLFDRAGVSEIVWNQQENYGNNGFGLAFTLNIQNAIIKKPPGYGEASIATVAQYITDKQSVPAFKTVSAEDSRQPNVIFIMNEAFWDPTLLPDVSFSEDPIPTVHRLQQESTSGYLLSPQFGGGTSNVEFEVLTGNSMSFLPSGSVPYQQYVNQPVPSLASYFESKGYKSMGIHSYDGWFWNRDNVYKNFGFESFKSKDKFDNPEYKGNFISDDEVSRSIISAVEESERPMFIYAVTMQNHGAYDDSRYGENAIRVDGNLTPEAAGILETYTHGARDADQSLQLLIDHFEQSDQPTVIVFYGDHLPMLGFDYDVYKQAGFIGKGTWSLEELKKMRSVPFVVWSNFDLPQEQVPTISNSFLGGYILDKLDMELPANFAFTLDLFKQYPGLLSNLVVDAEQNMYATAPEAAKPALDQYRELQYDLLFGNRYLAHFLDADYLTKSALDDYNMEFEPQIASEAPAAEDEDDSI
ncbi:LTA synthase family protein [Paenibacillus hodogayensis]|uniref:LTA synthase family protein n=1 Tax=Paenibacillus hodogayensis TaxID=279208 RepID=A0ABV5W5S9_9BACL